MGAIRVPPVRIIIRLKCSDMASTLCLLTGNAQWQRKGSKHLWEENLSFILYLDRLYLTLAYKMKNCMVMGRKGEMFHIGNLGRFRKWNM